MHRLLLLALLIFLPFSAYADEVVEGQAKVSPSRLPLEELRAFAEIFERIRTS